MSTAGERVSGQNFHKHSVDSAPKSESSSKCGAFIALSAEEVGFCLFVLILLRDHLYLMSDRCLLPYLY